MEHWLVPVSLVLDETPHLLRSALATVIAAAPVPRHGWRCSVGSTCSSFWEVLRRSSLLVRLPLGTCGHEPGNTWWMLGTEGTIDFILDWIIVIGCLWWCIVHHKWMCSFIRGTENLLNHLDTGIFSFIVIILHGDYFGIRVIAPIVVYVHTSLRIHFGWALLHHPLIILLALLAASTSTECLYLKPCLLALG